MSKKIEDMPLEDKVNEILKYQRMFYKMTIMRIIFSIFLFIVLVILPLVGLYYTIDYLNNSLGAKLNNANHTLEKAKSLGGLSDQIEDIKELFN